MSAQGRQSLYQQFKAGELPSEEAFRDLIASMLHMEDEGFQKTPDHGLQISAAVDAKALLTFYRDESARKALWTLRYGGTGEQLGVHAGGAPHPAEALLVLDKSGRVGINTRQPPQHMLHVDGTIGAVGRVGTYALPPQETPPLADGRWHALTPDLTGCVAFEIVASASGAANEGRQSMLHATALNAHNHRLNWFDRGERAGDFSRWLDRLVNRWFNPRNRIRAQQAWYLARCDRLELAWENVKVGSPNVYRLMIRTQCSYGGDVPIQVHVTRLWPIDDAPRKPAPEPS